MVWESESECWKFCGPQMWSFSNAHPSCVQLYFQCHDPDWNTRAEGTDLASPDACSLVLGVGSVG